jgi:hypothetical protein
LKRNGNQRTSRVLAFETNQKQRTTRVFEKKTQIRRKEPPVPGISCFMTGCKDQAVSWGGKLTFYTLKI